MTETPASPIATSGVVHVSSINWDWWWARQQHFTQRIARRTKTLFVEQMVSLNTAVRRRRLFRHISDNLWTLSPLKLVPFESRIRHVAGLNRRLMALLVRLAMAIIGMDRPILFFSTYDDHGLPARVPHSLVVYDCLDLHEAFPWATGEEVALERRMLEHADLVVASSTQLADKLARLGHSALLVRNGVETDFLKTARGSANVHPTLRAIPAPRIGFLGYVANHLDLDLLDYVARERPNWSIVLVGRRTASEHELFLRPNVHNLGEVPYGDVPSVLRGFDVCLIPFKVNPLTEAADTIKLYEYLSAGKPVVSTDIAQSREFARFVTVARDPVGFLKGIEAELQGPRPAQTSELDSILAGSDWDARTDVLVEAMGSALARRPRTRPDTGRSS